MIKKALIFDFGHEIKVTMQYLSMIDVKAAREILEKTTPTSGTEDVHAVALQTLKDLEKAQKSVFALDRKLRSQRDRRRAARNN